MEEIHDLEPDNGAVADEVRRRGWVKQMKANKHVQGTDGAYAGKITDFVGFLFRVKPDVLTEGFRRVYEQLPESSRRRKGQERTRRSFVFDSVLGVDKQRLEETAMLRFDRVTEDVVLQWLADFKGRGRTTPSKSVYGIAQSALGDLYRRHGMTFPVALSESINDVKKGAQRMRAQEKVEGRAPMEEGKAAIPGHLYLELAEALLKSGEDVFCHTFAVCSWNLMCRVSNVADLRGAHLSMENDSLLISIVPHKADKEGERTDPKHCYANPSTPSVCVFTALSVYFSVYGAPTSAGQLIFEGGSQQDRFVDAIRRALDTHERLKAELERINVTAEDIASHSFRKGARSYCQGGTTGGPSTPSILLRGGWALEGIDKKYVRYEAAGDQFIGRIVAMLNINSPDFAVLPPHFDVLDDEVMQITNSCFPNAHKSLEPVLVQCLATLTFHRNYLRRTLRETHPLFKSILFTQRIVDKLSHRVAVSFAGDKISATGIPPHVFIQQQLVKVSDIVDELPGRVRSAISAEFEQRAIDSGSITRNVLQDMLEGMMGRLAESLQLRHQPQAPVRQEDDRVEAGIRTWNVNGQLRRVPVDFQIDTAVPSRTLFQLYCLGDRNSGICPYRKLQSLDVVETKQKKRLSDVMALMRPIESALKRQKKWYPEPTVDQVNEMWEAGEPIISIESVTKKGRRRRLNQLAWSTHLREYRKRALVDREDLVQEEEANHEDPEQEKV